MLSPKKYTQQVWDEMFQKLHESIYDGVNMLKTLEKVINNYDEKYSGKTSSVRFARTGDLQVIDGKKVWVNRDYDAIEMDTMKIILPSLRDVFIHDMQNFLLKWKNLENQALNEILPVQLGGNPKLLDRVLYCDDGERYNYFKNVLDFACHMEYGDETDLLNWIHCVVKGVVETTRRIAGLDINGRYAKTFVVTTAFGISRPGTPTDIKTRYQLVSEDTAMEYLELSKKMVPGDFKSLK